MEDNMDKVVFRSWCRAWMRMSQIFFDHKKLVAATSVPDRGILGAGTVITIKGQPQA